jgi:hypothetical protein
LSFLGDQEIGKYWDSSDSRSPFEERLTFGQLLQLDHGAFLRKRSINERKVQALIHAVTTAMGAHSGSAPGNKVAALGSSEPVVSAIVLPPAWSELENSSTLIVWSITKAVSAFLGTVSRSQYSEKLRDVLLRVEPIQFIVLVIDSIFSDSTALEISGLTEVEYQRISIKATRLLKELVAEQFGESNAVLREMLSGIGVYNQMLRRALGISEKCPLVEEVFLNILLQDIGASPVSIGSVCLKDFYTLDITRIQYFVDVIKSRLPLSENEMARELNVLLSALRPEDRTKILNSVAWLNRAEGSWISVSTDSI